MDAAHDKLEKMMETKFIHAITNGEFLENQGDVLGNPPEKKEQVTVTCGENAKEERNQLKEANGSGDSKETQRLYHEQYLSEECLVLTEIETLSNSEINDGTVIKVESEDGYETTESGSVVEASDEVDCGPDWRINDLVEKTEIQVEQDSSGKTTNTEQSQPTVSNEDCASKIQNEKYKDAASPNSPPEEGNSNAVEPKSDSVPAVVDDKSRTVNDGLSSENKKGDIAIPQNAGIGDGCSSESKESEKMAVNGIVISGESIVDKNQGNSETAIQLKKEGGDEASYVEECSGNYFKEEKDIHQAKKVTIGETSYNSARVQEIDLSPTATTPKVLQVSGEAFEGAGFSPESDTTSETHYYNATKYMDSLEQTYIPQFYPADMTGYWNAGVPNMENHATYGKDIDRQEMRTLKDQLLDLQISMNKSRVSMEFKLKTVLSEAVTDFQYWNETVTGVMEAIERKCIHSAVLGETSSPVSDVSDEEKTHLASAAQRQQQHQNGIGDRELSNPNMALTPSAPPYGMTMPCSRMAFPNRMCFQPYYGSDMRTYTTGYMGRPNHQHQPAFLFGHGIRPNQFAPAPPHMHGHGGIPFVGRPAPHVQSPMPAASQSVDNPYSGAGTPYPNRGKGGSPPQACFPKCEKPHHQASSTAVKSIGVPPGGTPFPPARTGGGSYPARKGNSPPQQGECHGQQQKSKTFVKERPKRKNPRPESCTRKKVGAKVTTRKDE